MRKSVLAAMAACLVSSGVLAATAGEEVPWPATPPQDQGLPYTRSSHATALSHIKNGIAVFPGSRYAYVNGCRVRLDDDNWHDEALSHDGTVFVPKSFISLLTLKEFKPDPAPKYLEDRWVYTVTRPPATIADGVKTTDVDGHAYVDLIAAAKAAGLQVTQHPRGIILIGQPAPSLDGVDDAHVDAIVTMFDTPEKFADPSIATNYLPSLKRQGAWTDHVKVTPEQLKVLNGPETKWPTAAKSEYDYTGFNQTLLGSKVPPPGVYPRILFNAEDVPMLAERIKSSQMGQRSLIEIEYLLKKSFWDESTSDGQIFKKLYSGDIKDLAWDVAADAPPNTYPGVFKGEKPSIHNSHIQYVPECLTTMALYCLLTNDDAHGRQAAAAIVSWFKLREPLVDEALAISDSEYSGDYVKPDGTVVHMHGIGGDTHWRTMQGVVAHMNTGLSLDFAGKWMTADEKETMRRIIAKATYGRRAYGQDGPTRFRDVNWVAWDLPHFIALCAIEGLEGFDKEAYESNCATVRAFCDWGIDSNGVIYESNGKTPGGLQFETLGIIALARRGENMFGHPHLRKMLTAQAQMTSPTGYVVVNSGTQYDPFSRAWLSFQFTDEMKAFFPGERVADYLMSRAKLYGSDSEYHREWIFDGFNADAFKEAVAKLPRLRMPSPTYPGFVHGTLYDTDFKETTREDLNLPLDFNSPVHGVFSAYSDNTKQAAWINMMVRPDHYIGAGHHHADAGMFHFTGSGVDWFTQSPFHQVFDGKYFNLVQVDGHSEPESIPGFGLGYPEAGKYLGARATADAAVAQADLTNCYSYRWLTQPGQYWTDAVSKLGWEMEPSEHNMQMFAGTARYKMRPWWAFYTYSNYIATSRAPFNPMKYVYRTTGLVRGPHPYGVVVDDLKKDEQSHLYQWVAMLNGGVWQAKVDGLAPNQIALAFREPLSKPTGKGSSGEAKPPIEPAVGEPVLVVCAVGLKPSTGDEPFAQVATLPGPTDAKTGAGSQYDRLAINHRGDDAGFKVLLIPTKAGEPLPTVQYDAKTDTAKVSWQNQSDELAFTQEPSGQSQMTVTREGKTLIASK